MKVIKFLLRMAALVLLLGVTGACSSDDDKVDGDANYLVGEWMASHHSINPNDGDTCDMWEFTFRADGTGTGNFPMPFEYKIDGDRITLRLMATSTYYGRIVYEYRIVSMSNDKMEWEEIPDEQWGGNCQYLVFSRKK